jgi:Asp-tRNA(Asn)/Glu-tRNA(Gln) amidotransferase A subunit family amidase
MSELHSGQTEGAAGFVGLEGQANLLAGGHASSSALVDAALGRIAASQPRLNAFRCVREQQARDEAAAADRRLAAGERLPLLGVPVAIKDDMNLAGEITAFGCAGAFAQIRSDGEVAKRLRAAGAVIVGKTTTPEFGQWPWTEGPAFGSTRNPWSPAHTPGGSSGGSAAAVAAGLVPGAVGSDGAGSIRIPAAWCHLVGIKPQRGRVSTWPDAEPFNGLTCYGPLTRSVADAALLLDVLTGNHPEDRYMWLQAGSLADRVVRAPELFAVPASTSGGLGDDVALAVAPFGGHAWAHAAGQDEVVDVVAYPDGYRVRAARAWSAVVQESDAADAVGEQAVEGDPWPAVDACGGAASHRGYAAVDDVGGPGAATTAVGT